MKKKEKAEPILICGNEAVGEAAIQAGCRAYFGYPITPQNELTAYMAARMPEEGRVFIQSESELAAINMVFGASALGVRAMTSSSSPGISLKQEGISYLAGCELPAVIVNMSRGGPGLGNIGPSQSDYFQATRGGGHGDYRTPVLAGASVQELADTTFLAFNLADRYRTPVLILGDGILGQMMEPVSITHPEPTDLPQKDWILGGASGRSPRVIKSLFLKPGALDAHNRKLQGRYRTIQEKEVRYEDFMTSDATLILVAYGITARLCREVIKNLRQEGYAVGLLRPITLWPFPTKKIKELARTSSTFLTVEMNYGQMVEDVRLSVNGNCPVEFFGYGGGEILTVEEIEEAARKYILS
ncbi:MAG: 3-methyl-2-oxobutanoate dehydrogenase subunit VorB [Candidatus Euphemobacter frigidus]|nr:3-methyl-2-oxobutanoate dehydrogenase subunit VorB [Candidatus Euphemobacter frigidus]MDP8274847.1 3-methyl-2-oxobutanoate dehydrogenase subunit VorB [Candidatus Euphemobacter frigidus]